MSRRGLLSAICSAVVGIVFYGLCALTLAAVIGL